MSQLISIFPLFLGMVMYANKSKTKEKQILTETYVMKHDEERFFPRKRQLTIYERSPENRIGRTTSTTFVTI